MVGVGLYEEVRWHRFSSGPTHIRALAVLATVLAAVARELTAPLTLRVDTAAALPSAECYVLCCEREHVERLPSAWREEMRLAAEADVKFLAARLGQTGTGARRGT